MRKTGFCTVRGEKLLDRSISLVVYTGQVEKRNRWSPLSYCFVFSTQGLEYLVFSMIRGLLFHEEGVKMYREF
jgi:hypothetical protein